MKNWGIGVVLIGVWALVACGSDDSAGNGGALRDGGTGATGGAVSGGGGGAMNGGAGGGTGGSAMGGAQPDASTAGGGTVAVDASADAVAAGGGAGGGATGNGGTSSGGAGGTGISTGGVGTGGTSGGGTSSGGDTGTGGTLGTGGTAFVGDKCRSSLDCHLRYNLPPTYQSMFAPCDQTTHVCSDCATDVECSGYSPGTSECISGTCSNYKTCVNSLDCIGQPNRLTICTTIGSASICRQCSANGDCNANERCYLNECLIACTSDNTCVPLGLLCSSATNGVCIQCKKDADCAAELRCTSGACVPASCIAGKSYCDANQRYTCNSDRAGFNAAGGACSAGTRCVESGNTASCLAIAPPPVTPPASCQDGLWDGNETDVDCGGPDCAPCGVAQSCVVNADCSTSTCSNGTCFSCTNGVKDGNETDVDCGGACAKCGDGAVCVYNSDCQGGVCSKGHCASCSNGIQDGNESDVDCGSGGDVPYFVCPLCGGGLKCVGKYDCLSNICDATKHCTFPTCNAPACPPCDSGIPCCTTADKCGCEYFGYCN